MATISTKMNTDWQTMPMEQLKANYELMAKKLEARRATCRASSKKYYDKTFKLKDNASKEQIEKNKASLDRRDKYQKSYYEKNKEAIKIKQKAYRQKKAQERKRLKELQKQNTEEKK